MPAVPGPGTPELREADSPAGRTEEAEIPVPDRVPVVDLSQEDDGFHESPPTPAPLVSVAARQTGRVGKRKTNPRPAVPGLRQRWADCSGSSSEAGCDEPQNVTLRCTR